VYRICFGDKNSYARLKVFTAVLLKFQTSGTEYPHKTTVFFFYGLQIN